MCLSSQQIIFDHLTHSFSSSPVTKHKKFQPCSCLLPNISNTPLHNTVLATAVKSTYLKAPFIGDALPITPNCSNIICIFCTISTATKTPDKRGRTAPNRVRPFRAIDGHKYSNPWSPQTTSKATQHFNISTAYSLNLHSFVAASSCALTPTNNTRIFPTNYSLTVMLQAMHGDIFFPKEQISPEIQGLRHIWVLWP